MRSVSLPDLESSLRRISIDLWVLTVDDPDTATPASEAAGMTPKRLAVRRVKALVDSAADAIEAILNTDRS